MAAPMANVRVKLLFPDPTENCWFLINTEADRLIRDVEHRVVGRFGRPDVCVSLFLDGCRLPSEESTLVLRDNDNINVKFTESGCDTFATPHEKTTSRSPAGSVKKKHKKKRHLSEEPENREHECKKKRWLSEENEVNEYKKKKKKKSHSKVDDQEIDPVKISPNQDEVSQQSGDEKKITEDLVQNNIEENVEASKTKHKRRSRRKRKTSTKTAIVVTELCVTPFAGPIKPKPTVAFSSNWLPTNRKQDDKKHMFFDSDQEPSGNAEAIVELTEDAKCTVSFQPEPSAIQQRLGTMSMEVNSVNARPDTVHTIPTASMEQDEQRPKPTETVPNGENGLDEDTETLGIAPDDIKGYKVVPPPADYRPKYLQNRSSRRNSPANLLQGAQVFSRKRCKKNAFHPFSKEEQLNTILTNKSLVFQNSSENVGEEKPEEPPKDYSSMEQLHGLPREKDRIAFKTLELSEDCTPEMSDFQEAVVLGYDPVTKMVKVEMLPSKGVRKPSRFDLVVEDENEVLTNVSEDNLKTLSWSSLVDVRLLPST